MKRVYIIVASITTFFIILLGIILMPYFRQKHYTNNLKKEVNLVVNYVNHGKGKFGEIKKYIKKDVTSGNYKSLEKSIDKYLTDVVDNYENYNKIYSEIGNTEIIIEFNKDDLVRILESLYSNKESLNNLRNIFNDMNIEKYILNTNKKMMNLYLKMVKDKIKSDKIIEDIDLTVNVINSKIVIMEYLQSNQEVYNLEGKIVFLKRAKFNEFTDLINEHSISIQYELVNDVEGPVINGKNVVITQGDYVDLDNIVSCIDEVDGQVVCDINGSYNNDVPGTYTLNIRAKDMAKNESSRDINIIVKEKEKYNLPYVIEVIRNQSTTIVYGQDENGEYTKIVNVFVCSPGAGENTPVGTFYSRKGYPWGGLYGGVFGQYSTIISGHYLFHSVPYYSMSNDSLWWEAYNQLGSKVSMGCIRLTVRDAKWIYDNCPTGTMVKIYDGDLPSGVEKPTAQKISADDPNRGWDPTDPNPNNPWNK